MKVLIAILSCELYRTNGNNDAVLNTWMPLVRNADCKIFMGQGSHCSRPDEVFLDAADDYQHVTYKTRELYKWADREGYAHIFKCYPDTYVCPERLMASGFEKYDYSGNFACKPMTGAYCCGGTGYWASHAAYSSMVNVGIPTEDTVLHLGRGLRPPARRGPTRPTPNPETIIIKCISGWAEDQWSGDGFAKIKTLKRLHDPRYEDNVMSSGPEATNLKITQHLSRPVAEGMPSLYDNAWMYAKHQAWLDSLSLVPKIKKIAVITPTLASRSILLDECKASVKEQTWYGEILHAVGEDLTGVGAATMRNNIVRNLDPSFEWLAFLDDDDKFHPNHLAMLVEASTNADIVYSDCEAEGFVKTWQTRDFDYTAVKESNYIPVTCLMRRSIFEKIGGFDLKHYPGEDQWTFLNAALAGARFKYVPQVTWTYRKSPQHRCPSI